MKEAKYKQIEGHPDLLKDATSHAVINKNAGAYEKAKQRENAGMGIEWTLDTASLFQVPLKIEVAFPLNDPDYKNPQFIFLGVLTGS